MIRFCLTPAVLAGFLFVTEAAALTVEFDAKDNGATPAESYADRFVPFTLDAGTYSVTLFEGAFMALSVWNSIAGCDLDGNCTKGWLAKYTIVDEQGGALLSYSSQTIRSTESAALADAQADGPQTLINPADQTLYVGLFDSPTTDNQGGMSLRIENTTPIPLPAGGLLVLSGLATLAAVRRRRS